jgi:hypothetical protein
LDCKSIRADERAVQLVQPRKRHLAALQHTNEGDEHEESHRIDGHSDVERDTLAQKHRAGNQSQQGIPVRTEENRSGEPKQYERGFRIHG